MNVRAGWAAGVLCVSVWFQAGCEPSAVAPSAPAAPALPVPDRLDVPELTAGSRGETTLSRVALQRFRGEVDVASGTFRITSEGGGQGLNACALDVQSDGTPGTNPPDSIEIYTETGTLATLGDCAPEPGQFNEYETAGSLCGQVRIRNFYSVPFTNVWASIATMEPVGTTGYGNPGAPPYDVDGLLTSGFGRWTYGDLDAAGGPGASTVAQWVLSVPSGVTRFSFTGQVLAYVAESCDGLDNDCDGAVDENLSGDALAESCYGGPMGTANVGTCMSGVRVCGGGAWGTCVGEVLPGVEVCDGLDNDCDGVVDEGGVCAPPTVVLASVDAIGETTVDATVQVTSIGSGPVTARGLCWGPSVGVEVGGPGVICSDEGATSTPGSVSTQATALSSGTTYRIRAYASNVHGTGYSVETDALTIPSAPNPVVASKGTSTGHVTVSWNPSVGADTYEVLRDGFVVATGVTGSSWDDTGETAGSVPTVPLSVTATTNRASDVRVEWTSSTTSNGPNHLYQVRGVNASGTSGDSTADIGFRGMYPVTHYEYSTNGGVSWTSTGSTLPWYDDTAAPAPTLSAATGVTASDGAFADRVALQASAATSSDGGSRTYQVRAVSGAGPSPASGSATGNRAATGITYQWERSSGDADSGYGSLSGATSLGFDDTTAPADGGGRWYRIRASMAGVSDAVSSANRGYRFVPRDVLELASGRNFTCAITANRTVACWGHNGDGQLGQGNTTASNVPVLVSGVTGAMRISTGLSHACALQADGQLKCWGYNTYGQIGNGSVGGLVTSPHTVSLGKSAVDVDCGYLHTCAVLADGTVKCWGYNQYGGVGNGTSANNVPSPAVVTGLTGARQISAGDGHTCVTRTSGGYACWGYNNNGGFGNGTSATTVTTPQYIDTYTDVKKVATGDFGTCVLRANGTVWCAGYNVYGSLGRGNTNSSTSLVQTTGLSAVKDIAAHGFSACALLADGTMACWGDNGYGQVGNGTNSQQNAPVAVSGLSDVIRIVDSEEHQQCAVLADGTARCWGRNNHGQLGDQSTTDRNEPVAVNQLPSARGIRSADGGVNHACAVRTDGVVVCWGLGTNGMLGDGLTAARSSPVVATALSGLLVTEVAAGQVHTCALISDGTVRCFGNNTYGQLGNGTFTTSLSAVDPGVTDVVQLVGGSYHACGLEASGSLSCWGQADFGQLGHGSTDDSNVPVGVLLGSTTLSSIASGNVHTCGLTPAGALSCWGSDSDGQVGDGSPGGLHSSPVAVGGVWSQVEGGSDFTCGLRVGDSAHCWGKGTNGRLGTGDTQSQSTPKPLGLVEARGLTLGGGSACAVSSGGAPICWGANDRGQVGDGTQTDALSPVAITGQPATPFLMKSGVATHMFPGGMNFKGVGGTSSYLLGNGSLAGSLTWVEVAVP